MIYILQKSRFSLNNSFNSVKKMRILNRVYQARPREKRNFFYERIIFTCCDNTEFNCEGKRQE